MGPKLEEFACWLRFSLFLLGGRRFFWIPKPYEQLCDAREEMPRKAAGLPKFQFVDELHQRVWRAI